MIIMQLHTYDKSGLFGVRRRHCAASNEGNHVAARRGEDNHTPASGEPGARPRLQREASVSRHEQAPRNWPWPRPQMTMAANNRGGGADGTQTKQKSPTRTRRYLVSFRGTCRVGQDGSSTVRMGKPSQQILDPAFLAQKPTGCS